MDVVIDDLPSLCQFQIRAAVTLMAIQDTEESGLSVAEIRQLVTKTHLLVDAAWAETQNSIATYSIPKTIGRETLGLLD